MMQYMEGISQLHGKHLVFPSCHDWWSVNLKWGLKIRGLINAIVSDLDILVFYTHKTALKENTESTIFHYIFNQYPFIVEGQTTNIFGVQREVSNFVWLLHGHLCNAGGEYHLHPLLGSSNTVSNQSYVVTMFRFGSTHDLICPFKQPCLSNVILFKGRYFKNFPLFITPLGMSILDKPSHICFSIRISDIQMKFIIK